MAERLGRTLLIVNPAAQNGAGAEAGREAAGLLEQALGDALQVVTTAATSHASQLAQQAQGFQTVIALGGDGVINEVANGLMDFPSALRPTLGVIPVGSGNDYARTLGMAVDPKQACAQLLQAQPAPADLGNVNGRWFVETLSFGVDAAIALDTVERRVRTGRTGTRLYLESGFNQLLHHFDVQSYRASFDGAPASPASAITFAIQVGPTYGGGFAICPQARIGDGLLDICIAHPPVSVLRACGIFLLAKGGRHTGLSCMEMRQAKRLRVEFDCQPPAQVDGERLDSTSFDVSLAPQALRVLVAKGKIA